MMKVGGPGSGLKRYLGETHHVVSSYGASGYESWSPRPGLFLTMGSFLVGFGLAQAFVVPAVWHSKMSQRTKNMLGGATIAAGLGAFGVSANSMFKAQEAAEKLARNAGPTISAVETRGAWLARCIGGGIGLASALAGFMMMATERSPD